MIKNIVHKGLKRYFTQDDRRNWRITFRFENGDALDVNLEDYH